MTNENPQRHDMIRAIGKALLVYHVLAWLFMALNPWALPSGLIDILMAPAFLILFAFFIFVLPFDPVSLTARIVALCLLVLAVRWRNDPRFWWLILAWCLALAVAGARVALTVARL